VVSSRAQGPVAFTPSTVFMVNLPIRDGRARYRIIGLFRERALSSTAICTILTESKELVGPRLHIYHEMYLVSQMGYTGEGAWVVKGAEYPARCVGPCASAPGRNSDLGLHFYFG
jgi:hypothetical protein